MPRNGGATHVHELGAGRASHRSRQKYDPSRHPVPQDRAAKSERDGGWTIDPAELHRVFPPVPAGSNGEGVAEPRDAMAVGTVATGVLEAQVAALRETVDLLRRQLDGQAALVEDVRTDRDHWRAQAEALPRLLAPPERRPWWRRLAG